MILPDTNIWVALTVSGHRHHAIVHDWFETVPAEQTVHFCRATQRSMFRILTTAATHAPLGDPPLTNTDAWSVYERTITDTRVGATLGEPTGLDVAWRRFSARATASPKLWMDSYLAAFAICAHATFVTIDQAFKQFDGLDLHLIEA